MHIYAKYAALCFYFLTLWLHIAIPRILFIWSIAMMVFAHNIVRLCFAYNIQTVVVGSFEQMLFLSSELKKMLSSFHDIPQYTLLKWKWFWQWFENLRITFPISGRIWLFMACLKGNETSGGCAIRN